MKVEKPAAIGRAENPAGKLPLEKIDELTRRLRVIQILVMIWVTGALMGIILGTNQVSRGNGLGWGIILFGIFVIVASFGVLRGYGWSRGLGVLMCWLTFIAAAGLVVSVALTTFGVIESSAGRRSLSVILWHIALPGVPLSLYYGYKGLRAFTRSKAELFGPNRFRDTDLTTEWDARVKEKAI